MGVAAALTRGDRRTPLSIVVPVDGRASALRATVASLMAQSDDRWEVVLVVHPAVSAKARHEATRSAASDDRITEVATTEPTRAAALSVGLAHATGAFVAVLDPADRLVPTAAASVHAALAADPTIDVLYTDEAAATRDGVVLRRFYKPDWSPERLRSQGYCSRLCVLRSELVHAVGGVDATAAGAEELDLLLRVTERARYVHHVPEVLCLRLDGTGPFQHCHHPANELAACRAVVAHLARLGAEATATPGALPDTRRVRRLLPAPPTVSVVIPTAGIAREVWAVEQPLVLAAVQSVVEVTEGCDLELVVVVDDITPTPVRETLRALGATVIDGRGPFNYSQRCNQGVAASSGEYVVLLNDDTLVEQADWITVMVEFLTDPGVGVVGARLRYADGTLQHAGVLLNQDVLHIFRSFCIDDPGPFGLLHVAREVSAVTGACLATTRRTWDELGGLDDEFAVAYNDIDFCLRVRASGRRVIWTPDATLYHFESQSRGHDVDPDEQRLMSARWGHLLDLDPYGNPNLAPQQAEWRPAERRDRIEAARRLILRFMP